jgi:hypothetical protein
MVPPTLQLFLCVTVAPVVGWMWCFELTAAAGWNALGVLLLQTFSVAVTTPVPQAAGRLSAVDPDVAKAFAIVALGQTTFRLICLYFDNCVAEV